MSALEIILLLVVLGLGGLVLFEIYKRRQMERQLNQAQSELHDATQKMSALNEAFSTRRLIEGNLGEKLRDLSDYIHDVQDAYATELNANTALVSGFKAKLNAPAAPPPQLSEDNQADEVNATLSETIAPEPQVVSEPKVVPEPKDEPEPQEAAPPKTAEKTDKTVGKAAENPVEKAAEKPSTPAPISMEVQAPTDTHIDRKVTN